jgi:hypothetical protein
LPPEGGGAPPVALYKSDLDDRWDAFIARATAPDPAERFQTATQMQTALADLERHWEDQKARHCTLPSLVDTQQPQEQPRRSASRRRAALRTTPIKVHADTAKADFGLDDLWRPRTYRAPQLSTDGEGRIVDGDHGLLWQQSGSLYPLDWHAAHEAVAALNRAAFAEREDWRMPTMAELLTLVLPPDQGRHICQAPIFDTRQKWLWSADSKSFQAAWQVNLELGYTGWTDKSSRLYLRAVCTLE